MLVKRLSTKAVQFLQRSAIKSPLLPEKKPRKQPFPPSFCANAHPCCPRGRASPVPPLPTTVEAPFPCSPIFGDTPFVHVLPDGRTSRCSSSVSGAQLPEGQGSRPKQGGGDGSATPAPSRRPHPSVPPRSHRDFLERMCPAAPQGSARHERGCDLWKRVRDLYK